MEHVHRTELDKLPEYKCHKIVRAAKITDISFDSSWEVKGCTLLTFGDIGLKILVESSWVTRNGPITIGGYYVVYEDGYRSYSPEKQFNDGYRPVSDYAVKEEATKRLIEAMPFLTDAVKEANQTGTAKLGILSVLPDGSGKVICKFECTEFMADLFTVVGAEPATAEEQLSVDAVKFLQTHGIKRDQEE